MKFTYTMDLNCTPEKVWYWLGTPERAVQWQTNVSKTEILEKTPDWIGTTFRETIEENGKSAEMQGVVTDYRENTVLAMRMIGKYNSVEVEWHLQEMGERTLLIMNSDIRFKSILKFISIVLWPVFKKNIRRQLSGEYTKLKELCEYKENKMVVGEGIEPTT
ncbi:MAG: SRPBCC family protein [Dehalococcoidales bacterium]|nr:SRPBCC family protein [Dehalococcoidales bacterium]